MPVQAMVDKNWWSLNVETPKSDVFCMKKKIDQTCHNCFKWLLNKWRKIRTIFRSWVISRVFFEYTSESGFFFKILQVKWAKHALNSINSRRVISRRKKLNDNQQHRQHFIILKFHSMQSTNKKKQLTIPFAKQ